MQLIKIFVKIKYNQYFVTLTKINQKLLNLMNLIVISKKLIGYLLLEIIQMSRYDWYLLLYMIIIYLNTEIMNKIF
jgi:hypothetical protein